jgi:hypothetical protein
LEGPSKPVITCRFLILNVYLGSAGSEDMSIEAPPSLLPAKKYCDVTGLPVRMVQYAVCLSYAKAGLLHGSEESAPLPQPGSLRAHPLLCPFHASGLPYTTGVGSRPAVIRDFRVAARVSGL